MGAIEYPALLFYREIIPDKLTISLFTYPVVSLKIVFGVAELKFLGPGSCEFGFIFKRTCIQT